MVPDSPRPPPPYNGAREQTHPIHPLTRGRNRFEEMVLEQEIEPIGPDIFCIFLGILAFSLLGAMFYIFFLLGQESVFDSPTDCIITDSGKKYNPTIPKITSSTISINHTLHPTNAIIPSKTNSSKDPPEKFLPKISQQSQEPEAIEGSGEVEGV